MHKQYDVIIVGGGIIGISFALALADSALKIAIIEARVPNPGSKKISDTERTIVLAESSRIIFNVIGVWNKLSHAACPIREIHVSDQGSFGSTRISAKEEKVPALGYVLSANAIEEALYALLPEKKNITVIRPAKFISYHFDKEGVHVEINQEGMSHPLQSKLLVAADGNRSTIRKYKNISVTRHDYQQKAIICNITLKRSHDENAYERFTSNGPLAMLPLLNNQAAVVWTVKKDNVDDLILLKKEKFIAELQKSFGYRLGKIIDCTQPVAIDLVLETANSQIAPGLVLLGNAAHTLHPVAGQGLNLGLRDLAVLAEIIHLAQQKNEDLGNIALLEQYMVRRKKDQQEIIHFTHSLVGFFSNSLLPLIMARDVGMLLLDRIAWLKKILTKRMLGFAGKVPRLACGIPLE